MADIAEAGDEVLVSDPMYATYERVVGVSGADMVWVALQPENGFRVQAEDIAARITQRCRVIHPKFSSWSLIPTGLGRCFHAISIG